MIDQARINRELCLKLGWVESRHYEYGAPPFDPRHARLYLNFFASEDDSAMLLEALPDPVLFQRWLAPERITTNRVWECRHSGIGAMAVQDPDRKTAIVKAACVHFGVKYE